METVRVIISGIVQGVGFRYFLKDNATDLGITGFAINTSSGSVEAVFQGEVEKVKKLVMLCKTGPESASVNNVQETIEESTKIYDSFSVL